MSTVVETVQSQDFVPLSYPAFPPDTKPCVELETFSLAELLADNQTERKRLLETCKSRGFFYLNFTGSGVADLPNRAAQIVTEVGEKFFSLPREEKSKYSYSLAKGTIFGYASWWCVFEPVVLTVQGIRKRALRSPTRKVHETRLSSSTLPRTKCWERHRKWHGHSLSPRTHLFSPGTNATLTRLVFRSCLS